MPHIPVAGNFIDVEIIRLCSMSYIFFVLLNPCISVQAGEHLMAGPGGHHGLAWRGRSSQRVCKSKKTIMMRCLLLKRPKFAVWPWTAGGGVRLLWCEMYVCVISVSAQ